MTPLNDLASHFGIRPVTCDDEGIERPVPEAVLTGILEAFGVSAGTDAAVAASLESLHEDAARRGLPRCVSMRHGQPCAVTMHVREGVAFTLAIETEDGVILDVESIGQPTDTTTVLVNDTAQLRQCRTAVLPAHLPLGYHTLVLTEPEATHRCPLIVAPEAGIRHSTMTGVPASGAGGADPAAASGAGGADPAAASGAGERRWGVCADLFALRSHRSWGTGDFGDLSDLIIIAADAGADFVRLSPIHALPIREVSVKASKATPLGSPSPYLPSSRVAIDPIFLRIEDIPEIGQVPAEQRQAIQSLGRGWGPRNAAAEPIPRARVLADKLAALRILYSLPPTPTRRRLFDDYCQQVPESLRRWAVMSAAAAHFAVKRDPDAWRAKLSHPDSRAAAQFAAEHSTDVRFWLWTQFAAAEQLRRVREVAAHVGMRVGLITEVAGDVSPDGADAWAGRGADGRSLHLAGVERCESATADGKAGQAPWNPMELAAAGYQPVRDMLHTAALGAGAVSLDGLDRTGVQFWRLSDDPQAGCAAVDLGGEAIAAVLDLEAARLGIDIVSTTSIWEADALRSAAAAPGGDGFAGAGGNGAAGSPADPSQPVRTIAVLTPASHTPVAAYLNLADVEPPSRHSGEKSQRRMSSARAARQRVLKDAAEAGALAPTDTMVGTIEHTWPVVAGLHTYLGTLNAAYLGAALMDIVGQTALIQAPGSPENHPNWAVALQDGTGQAILIEELADHPGFAQIADILNAQTGRTAARCGSEAGAARCDSEAGSAGCDSEAEAARPEREADDAFETDKDTDDSDKDTDDSDKDTDDSTDPPIGQETR